MNEEIQQDKPIDVIDVNIEKKQLMNKISINSQRRNIII